MAESDADVILIHRLLCLVAGPSLFGAIDADKSIGEVSRVVEHEFAFMALHHGSLVGSLGLMHAGELWYSKQAFLTNRWFFVLPPYKHTGVGELLLTEARTIAQQFDLPLIIYKERRRGQSILVSGDGYMPPEPSLLPTTED